MSNEQRAHDLALVALLKENLVNKNIYDEYIEIYNLLLNKFNEDIGN
ncbi:MAG: hypothetical protein IJH12_07055 [Clostridia bacterium]|nr:hypothetical protein [Clostridia bacterium]